MSEALAILGVSDSTLTVPEKSRLDTEGFLLLNGVIDPKRLERLRSGFETGAASGQAGPESKKESGTRHVPCLVGFGPDFEYIFAHPKLLAAARHVLGRPFKLFGFNGRDPLPGFGRQGLHADWNGRVDVDAPFPLVNSLWLLDDMTPENGATRVIPGSHRYRSMVSKSFADPAARHPEQKLILAPAGSVLIFNGHLWHGGTRNDSSGPRRVLQCAYVGREQGRSMPGFAEIDGEFSPAIQYLQGREE